MSILDIVKRPLRPTYRILRKKLHLLTKNEKQQRSIEQSYATFSELAEKGEIANIIFENGKCILTLKDERRYFFDPFDRVARMYSVPYSGTFEAKETQFLRTFIKPGYICVDAGANFGWHTILFSKLVGSNGHVHSFEPLPHTFRVLERNISLNRCDNVSLNNIALDETNSRKDLYLPDIGVSGSLRLHDYSKDYQKFNVVCKKFDSYCSTNKIRCVDFIKADIEGAELLLLKGGSETIKKHKPALFLEIQGHSTKLFKYAPVDIFDWLHKLGYLPYIVLEDGNLHLLNDYQSNLPDYNFIFLPKRG